MFVLSKHILQSVWLWYHAVGTRALNTRIPIVLAVLVPWSVCKYAQQHDITTIHNFITSGYKPEYEYKYITFIAAKTETHSWVFYLGRRLADPTTTGNWLDIRSEGTDIGVSKTGRKKLDLRGHFILKLCIKILATRVSTKFVLARLRVYSKILWYMHG